MNIDIDGLIELAKKATPGPWAKSSTTATRGTRVISVQPGRTKMVALAKTDNRDPKHEATQLANAEYIAAASPDTIIALCERLREAEKTIQNALSELKAGDVQSAIDQLEAGNE